MATGNNEGLRGAFKWRGWEALPIKAHDVLQQSLKTNFCSITMMTDSLMGIDNKWPPSLNAVSYFLCEAKEPNSATD